MDTEKWNVLVGIKNWMKEKGIATDEILKMYDADFSLVAKHESDEEYFKKLHESKFGVNNLELDANGLLIHEEITNSFDYKGGVFLLTNRDECFTIVDSGCTIKESGIDLYDLVTIVQNKWDESLKLNKKK
jgi:hypothetical protein